MGKKKFSKKLHPIHVQNTLGHFWERFCAFLDFWKFFDFLKTFQRLDPPWNTGQKMFTKKLPQNMFNTRLDNLGTILGLFGMLKVFYFKKSISKNRLSTEQGAIKKFSKKLHPIHVQNTLGHFWERFCAFLDFWKFFDFLKTFRRLNPPWNTGQKKFTKKLPKNMFRTRLDTFGNDFGHFWTFENFSIFWKHFEVSTLHGTLGKKNFSKKVPPKHVQNTIGHFWERFWAFLDFWKILDFLKTFRRLDPPWNTGQKFFSKSTPKTCSKHNWTLLGKILGIFGILKTFWKHFEKSTLHGTLGKKKFSKKSTPKTCSKHNWTLLGTILGIFGILKKKFY